MLICPMCKKQLAEWTSECPRCRADLSILVDYVGCLHDGLVRADASTRRGELGEAVWAYLEVLEVDPDNAVARKQVMQVATAVRQFDRAARGRRWVRRLEGQARFRRWLTRWQEEGGLRSWRVLLIVILVALAFAAGYWVARPGSEPEKTGVSPGPVGTIRRLG
jgi:hypothetical protein